MSDTFTEYCKRCEKQTPHQEHPAPTWENPYEFDESCVICDEKERVEHETLMAEVETLTKRLKAQNIENASKIAWELVTGEPTLSYTEWERMDEKVKRIRENYKSNVEHDDALLASGPVYPKNEQEVCPQCGENNFRAVGESKYECGNCDFYYET